MNFDGKGLVGGRLSTVVAKKLINNEAVVIYNASEVVIVGTKKAILEKFRRRVNASVKSNPDKGPKYDRIPSKILKRMIKGMLPNRTRTAERLLKNLKIYNNSIEGVEIEKLKDAEFNERHDSMTLGEISKELGGKW